MNKLYLILLIAIIANSDAHRSFEEEQEISFNQKMEKFLDDIEDNFVYLYYGALQNAVQREKPRTRLSRQLTSIISLHRHSSYFNTLSYSFFFIYHNTM